jgi:hypothetical protein
MPYTLRGMGPAVSPGRFHATHLVVAAFVLVEIALVFGPYGYFIDELYYLSCSKRLAWGYVDHPPLSIAVLAVTRALFGASKLAIRLPAIAAVAASIIVSSELAARFGGGAFARILAAVCTATSTIALLLATFFSMNAFELLLWPAMVLVLVRIAQDGKESHWLVFGALLGVALENKHTAVVLAGALAIGVVATPMRARLRGWWPWLGLALAALIVLPNLLWQYAHGLPSLEFYRNAQAAKNVPTAPPQALFSQLLVSGPGAVVVWVAGAAWLLRTKQFRFVGIAFALLFVSMIVSGSSRPDRIAAIYSVTFAAGGVALERWVRRPWLRVLLTALPIVTAVGLGPVALPILAPEEAAAYGRALHVFPPVERGKTSPLPQPLADRTGWESFVGDVRSVVLSLSPEDRAGARILCPSYGQAGAIERFGPDLPPVVAGHNNWWLWGPGEGEPRVIIAIGFSDRLLARHFAEHSVALVHHCDYCMSWRNDMPIAIVRGGSLAEAWNDLKHYE